VGLELISNARRALDGQLGGRIAAAGPVLWPLVKAKAFEIVGELSLLPPIPNSVWSLRDASSELSRLPAHRGTWGVLVASTEAFSLCHSVADMFRGPLGYSSAHLSDSAPRWALVYRGWQKLMADNLWSEVRPELRLSYALAHGYEPGLWRPDEVRVTAEDKRFSSRLRNLGAAVLGGSAA
jgi:hypothetical protein